MTIILLILCSIALPFIVILLLFVAMWLSKLFEIFIEFLNDHLPND